MYRAMYEASIRDPETFWGEHGRRLDWISPIPRVKNMLLRRPDVSIRWFEDGTLNVSANCIDRHLQEARRPGRDHLGGDDPRSKRRITYRELHDEVCRFANVLKAHGVKQGRPGDHLPADDPRGRLRHARLRADRRRSIRWCSAASRRIRSPVASRTASQARHHRRRGLRGGTQGAAQGTTPTRR